MRPEAICLECGLCCNGVIFADVKLQPGDDPRKLRAAGLKLRKGGFSQPCKAHDGCKCAIYPDRPTYCRQFDCGLLRRVKLGEVTQTEALRTIKRTLDMVKNIRSQLRTFGDNDSAMPLRTQFERVTRRLEKSDSNDDTARRYAKLTLNVHELNRLLAAEFYPGAGHKHGT